MPPRRSLKVERASGTDSWQVFLAVVVSDAAGRLAWAFCEPRIVPAGCSAIWIDMELDAQFYESAFIE